MSSFPTQPIPDDAGGCHVASAGGRITRLLLAILDAALTRRSTWVWRIGLLAVAVVGLTLHVSACLGIPAIATADTNDYCAVTSQLEAGQWPDLRDRNIGYPLFLFICKQLPISLSRGLPLVQHMFEVVASIILMFWMRRRWGVLAGLALGALLVINSSRVIWTHYGHPNALLISVVPLATLLLATGVNLRRWGILAVAALLWAVVHVCRDEVLLVAGIAPLLVLWRCRGRRGAVLGWYVVVLCIGGAGIGARWWVNKHATAEGGYATHHHVTLAWRGLHTDALVAPPRPQRLEEFYETALANGAKWRGDHLHYEDLWRAGRSRWGMTRGQATQALAAISIELIRRRPGAYAETVLRDAGRLWLDPPGSLEWAAFSKSSPVSFASDASRLTYATHLGDFDASYPASGMQRLFHRLAVLRPGQSFASRPLAICFVAGTVCLALGVGVRRRRLCRWWQLGLALMVVEMTLLYAAMVDVPHRYRMTLEWAFYATAVLGIVLPLIAVRRHLQHMRRSEAGLL